jgi:ATP-dependent helicase HepA
LTIAATRIPGLLLLTATPMHAGAEGFLRLMNLVDPQAYHTNDLDSFRRRLRMRQQQATQIELLQPGVPTKIISDVLRDFGEEYADDPRLLKMLAEAQDSLTSDDTDRARRLAAVSDYLRETYRISRRVIRHRRDAASTRGYPVSGRQSHGIEVRDGARPLLDDFLNDWRALLSHYSGQAAAELFADGVAHVLAGPGPALEFIQARLVGADRQLVSLSSTELALLQNTAAALELHGTGTRADRLIAHIKATSRAGRKVLVFTSFTSQVHAVADSLRHCGALADSFAIHIADMSANTRDAEVNRFLYEPDCAILLADNSAEEGRNFQMVDELIHLDLPLSPNAIEQRIGRVDRFNLRARPSGTLTAYLVEPDSPWTQGQLHFLRDVAGVFDRSVATLQRPLAELEERVHGQLLSGGPKAFEIPVDQAAKMLVDERVEQDLLSEIEDTLTFTDFGDASYDDLLRFEESSGPVKDAFRKLMRTDGGIGLQARCVDAGEKIFKFRLSDARYGVRGLTPDECEELDRILPGRYTFDKVVAATQSAVTPIRIGEQLTDWLTNFLRTDERGRAIAVLTKTDQVSESQLWFGFDYLVQFDDSPLIAYAAETRKRLRRRGDAFFAPRIETVWTDGYLEAPTATRAVLTGTVGVAGQRPLRGRDWEHVLPHFPDWAERTARAAALAATIVDSRPAVTAARTDAISRVTAEAEHRIQILRARAVLHPGGQPRRGEIDSETSLMNQVDRGLRRLKVSMLACVAIVLLPDNG